MQFHDIKKYASEKSAGRLATIYNKADCRLLRAFLRVTHPLKTSKAFGRFYLEKEKIDARKA